MITVALASPFPVVALVSLGALAILLAIAVWRDVAYRIISNQLCLAVALLAPAYWVAMTGDPMGQLELHATSLALATIPLLALFVLDLMGGGDVKLLAALTMWLRPGDLLPMLYATALVGGLLGVAMLIAARLRRRPTPSIPYGVAIATGALLLLSDRVAPLLNAS